MQKNLCFQLLEEEDRSILGEEHFVKMHSNYLFFKKPMGLPYSIGSRIEGICSQLLQTAIWGQYMLESEELGIQVNVSKTVPNGLHEIVLKKPIQNVPGFTDYFSSPVGLRTFGKHGAQVKVTMMQKNIGGETCTWFETGWDLNAFPWHLRHTFLFYRGNEIFTVRTPYNMGVVLGEGNFGSDGFLMETFATTDEALNQDAFSLSEENGFFRVHCAGIGEEVKADGRVLKDCLVLSHQYIHPNCFASGLPKYTDFEMYTDRELEYHTFWQKGTGLAGFEVNEHRKKTVFVAAGL